MAASSHQTHLLIHLLLVTLLPLCSFSLVSSPLVAPNPLYSSAGVFVFNTAPFYNTGITTFNPYVFSINLFNFLTPYHHIGYAIHELDYNYSPGRLNFSVWIPPLSWASSSITAEIYTNEANKFNVLKISYIVIEPHFEEIQFKYVWLNPNRSMSFRQSYLQSVTGLGPFHRFGNLSFWNVFTGMDVALNSNDEFDLSVRITKINQTSLLFNITTLSSSTIFVNTVIVGAFIFYPEQLIFSHRFAFVSVGIIDPTDNLKYQSSGNEIQSFNTIIGVLEHHIRNPLRFVEKMLIQIPDTVRAQSNQSFVDLKAMYLYLQFPLCQNPTPYFLPSNGSCLSNCPIDHYLDGYNQCKPYCPAGFFQEYSFRPCEPCPWNCQFCTSNFSCSFCLPGYYLSGNMCVLSCAGLQNCASCSLWSNQLVCSSCLSGASLINGLCVSICGDSIRMSEEQCDDGNSAGGDGCSSLCKIEPFYFCQGSLLSISTCQFCSPGCSNCTDGMSCLACQTGFLFNPMINMCQPCSSYIPNCLACSSSFFAACQSCDVGYQLMGMNCAPICGDGLKLSEEQCDNGNFTSIEGCLNCMLQPAYFCEDVRIASLALPTSQCAACIPHCSICQNTTKCTICDVNYIYVNVNSTFSCILRPVICGDAFISSTQICDDGNLLNDDGCSSSCQIEQNFICSVGGNGSSVCSINPFSIELLSIDKEDRKNSFVITYGLVPSMLIYKVADWNAIVRKQTPINANITGCRYDENTGQLTVKMDYADNLNGQTMVLGFTYPSLAPFDRLPPMSSSVPLSTSNNLSLQVYSQQDYILASAVEYLSMSLSILSLLFFLLGFLSGKLVSLQLVAVFQLTYFSLLSLEDVGPSFASLRYLSYSCGFSFKLLPTLAVHRRFTGIYFDYAFLNNYNVIAIFLALPLICSAIITLVNRCFYQDDKQKNERLTIYAQKLRGQSLLYALLFSAYLLVVNIGISAQYPQYLHGYYLLGLVIDGLLLLLLTILTLILAKRSLNFGEFVDKFVKNKCLSSHYYCWMSIQRVIMGVILSLVSISYQSAIIIGLLLCQIVTLAYFRPYEQEKQGRKNANIRPILNLAIAAAIQLILCLQAVVPSALKSFSIQLPIIILLLLLATLPYNIYYWIRQLACQNTKKEIFQTQQQVIFINSERQRVQELNSLFLKENPSILQSTNRPMEGEAQTDNTAKDALKVLKDKLTLMKSCERNKEVRSPIGIQILSENPLDTEQVHLAAGI